MTQASYNPSKPSDDLTGNDSVVGTPAGSRPGSPPLPAAGASGSGVDEATRGLEQTSLGRKPSFKDQGVTLESFKRALAGNAQKKRTELQMED